MKKGNINVSVENIFPLIKKFLYSDHEIFLRELISNATDATLKLKHIAGIGKEKIEQYGKVYNTEHFKLNSKDINTHNNKKRDFDVWYDKRNFRILRVSYSRMGNWEYRLKTID